MKKAVELGISKNLTFSGLVDYEKVLQLLQTCNILVLARPSGIFAEAGFPTKLGEYLICKKPVVITKVGDIPLYFKDGFNAMLAEPDNPQSVADKIEFLIENPKTGIKIAENGFNWAKENLEYKMATRKIIEFMENGK
jgi:glycosyltransferase involved in cell wall biosynthesis